MERSRIDIGRRARHGRLGRLLAGVVAALALTSCFTLFSLPAAAAGSQVPVTRVAGTDAVGTAIAVSQADYPAAASAKAVVLARSDFFSDALAGGPLAAKVGGPLLITPGADQSSQIDPRVLTEIERVLPTGSTVYVLGGDLALSADIDTTLEGEGYVVHRIAGADEYATAVDIAEELGNPTTIFEATGLNFPDALSAVPAAIKTHGAILLTDGNVQAPETASYLSDHGSDTRYAIGGRYAAQGADPGADGIYGQDLYGTSAAVANAFFPTASTFGAATGADFQDALSGGPVVGQASGPMLLVDPSGPLPQAVSSYLGSDTANVTKGYLFGGSLAVGDDVLGELESPGAWTGHVAITPTTLPPATQGAPYAGSVSASGGVAPYGWTVISGSFPPGLGFPASEGPFGTSAMVGGTPTAPGTYSFVVQVTDSTAPTPETATESLSITVSAPTPTVAQSQNWSGYSILGPEPFTYVRGSFTVPSLNAGTPSTDALGEWVGVDGLNNSSLIQAGVGENPDPSAPGGVDVWAWWEILPAEATPITTVAVRPGDVITVTIEQASGSIWSIALFDTTNGQSFTTDQAYSGPGTSVEWIVEAPTSTTGQSGLAPFTPYVTFGDLGFGETESQLYEVVMVQSGVQVATPSAMDSNGFNVAYGSVAPPSP